MKLKIIAAMATSSLLLSSVGFAANPIDNNPQIVPVPVPATPAAPAMPQNPAVQQNQLATGDSNIGTGGDNIALPDSPPSNQLLAQNDFGNSPAPENMLAQNQNMAQGPDSMSSDAQPLNNTNPAAQAPQSNNSPTSTNTSPASTDGVSVDTATGDDDY